MCEFGCVRCDSGVQRGVTSERLKKAEGIKARE